MKKSFIVHLIVIVVAIIVGSFLASDLQNRQLEIMPFMKSKLYTKAPIGGFQKFSADVKWMRFIQFCGSQKTINDENKEEVMEWLNELISLDPNFEKSYSVGVQMLAVEAPEKAVEYLSQACDNKYLKKNWKIPFYAAFILTHHLNPPRYKESIDFYEKAMQRSGSPEKYLVNAYVRAKANVAKERGKAYDGTPLTTVDEATMYELYREWKKVNSGGMEDMGTSIIPDLNDRLLEAAKKVKETSKDPKMLEVVKKIREEVTKNGQLAERFMTPDELKTYVSSQKVTGGSDATKLVIAQIKAAEKAALDRIKAAEKAALESLKKAAVAK